MNKLPFTRLDDRLNAVLIAIGLASLMVLTLDASRDDSARSAAATQQAKVTTPAAPADAASTTAVASATPAH